VHAHIAGPSYPGSVVLELGADVGVLVIYTGPDQLGREIEISPVGAPGQRTHAAVRERRTNGRIRYGALYPQLPAGHYMIWEDTITAVGMIRVPRAAVAEFAWP
jgi:hypothetical protein